MAILNALSERLFLVLTDLMLSGSSWLPLVPGGKKSISLYLLFAFRHCSLPGLGTQFE